MLLVYVAGAVEVAAIEELCATATAAAHGALDWMFPIEMARGAAQALEAAGAAVTYREIDDLSHTYPSDMNGAMLEWLVS